MIGQTVSHYKIVEKLGEGGMGVVYKAQDTKLDRLVALKFLPSNFLASNEELLRFQQEAKTLSALNHPHIATIYDIDQSDEQKFIVLEYLSGGTLKSQINNLTAARRDLSISEVVDYGLQIAEGLSHAHRRGIVHRDVKTENMMLTEEGSVKITDFGLAKLKGTAQLTKAGSTVGTAAYMSPEQIRGEEIDHCSDIFSFGIVLYELATGRLPFRGELEAALSYSIVNEDPIPLKSLRPSIPSSLERIISRCLEKEREKRYQSAEEIMAELSPIRQEVSGYARTQTVPRWQALKMPLVTATVLLVIGLFALYVLLSPKFDSLDRKPIAVLPFKNLSEDRENEYFSDGITEDIITQLSKIGDLRVISRTSVMRYKNSDKSLRDIGSELDVAVILEGSVRRSGNRIRIVSQLIDAQRDEHLWAETYDRDLKDIFAIQSEVAQHIAAALKVTLSPAVIERLEKKPTENIDAYSYYLKGREYYYRYHKQANENAIEMFKKALELDPTYALAYTGLGDAYGQRVGIFGFPANWLDSAIAVSNKAISLDPNLAEAYKALGLAYENKGWNHRALEAYRRSVQFNPNYFVAIANIGFINLKIGNFDEALLWMKKSIELDPTFAFQYFGVGGVYAYLDDQVAAEQWFLKAIDLQPDFIHAHAGLSWLYWWQGKYQQYKERAGKILSIDPDNLLGLKLLGDTYLFSGDYGQAEPYYRKAIAIHASRMLEGIYTSNRTNLGFLLSKTGRRDESRRILDESLKLDEKDLKQGNEWYAIPYDMARIYALLGNKIEAYKWLQKAMDAGWRDYRFASIDPLFENLRNDEQFKQMMAQVKAMVDEMRKRVEEMEKQ
ncbi:MAG: protein kinase [Ignavibacteriales bacterium]|nr:protein kinase [Ignavibacteriales bacterium]